MDELLIQGGRRLKGAITISGAKNAALPAMAASILIPGKTRLSNIPDVRDVRVMCQVLEQLGCTWDRDGDLLEIDASSISSVEAPYDLVRTMRASVLMLGPLLARFGKARVSMPGGCAIGTRPIDIHLKALNKLGADISLDHGMMELSSNGLSAQEIYLDFPTVTGTENIMMAAMGAPGETTIYNAAREPEIIDLALLLTTAGASISGAGTDTVHIQPGMLKEFVTHRVIPDRIEAGTFAIAAAITGGEIRLKNIVPEHLTAVMAKLGQVGVDVTIEPGEIIVKAGEPLRPVNIQTAVYPGYPTDLQAQFMALMCLAEGESVITENIFENRFMHVPELNRMGADIAVRGRTAVIKGIRKFRGAEVMATDLRASASLVLAALAADNETRLLRVYHLDRGYERLEGKLQGVGAQIERLTGGGP